MLDDLNRIWNREVSIIDVIETSDATYESHMQAGNFDAANLLVRARLADFTPIPFDQEPDPPMWPCYLHYNSHEEMTADGWVHGDPQESD